VDASTIAGLVVSGVLTALLVAVLRSGTVRGLSNGAACGKQRPAAGE